MLSAERHPLARGRLPWREPRKLDDWIAVAAWLQAGLLLLATAAHVFADWALQDIDPACVQGEAACVPRDRPWFGALDALWIALVVPAAIAAIVVARRNLRGRGSRGAALSGLAAPWLVAVALLLAA